MSIKYKGIEELLSDYNIEYSNERKDVTLEVDESYVGMYLANEVEDLFLGLTYEEVSVDLECEVEGNLIEFKSFSCIAEGYYEEKIDIEKGKGLLNRLVKEYDLVRHS